MRHDPHHARVRPRWSTFAAHVERARVLAGIEQAIGGWLGLRATAGASRADFGGRATNIVVEKPIDFAVGLVLRF